jgi:hypothetical protein
MLTTHGQPSMRIILLICLSSGLVVLLVLLAGQSGPDGQRAILAQERDGASSPGCTVTRAESGPPPGLSPSPALTAESLLAWHGNGQLWLQLPRDGILVAGTVQLAWTTARPGTFNLLARRLDGPAPPSSVELPNQPPGSRRLVTLPLATAGCWQLTAIQGGQQLTVTLVVRPQPYAVNQPGRPLATPPLRPEERLLQSDAVVVVEMRGQRDDLPGYRWQTIELAQVLASLPQFALQDDQRLDLLQRLGAEPALEIGQPYLLLLCRTPTWHLARHGGELRPLQPPIKPPSDDSQVFNPLLAMPEVSTIGQLRQWLTQRPLTGCPTPAPPSLPPTPAPAGPTGPPTPPAAPATAPTGVGTAASLPTTGHSAVQAAIPPPTAARPVATPAASQPRRPPIGPTATRSAAALVAPTRRPTTVLRPASRLPPTAQRPTTTPLRQRPATATPTANHRPAPTRSAK